MTTMRLTAWLVLTTLVTSLSGCYNTYRVPSDEFRKLQSRTALSEDQRLVEKIPKEELEALQKLGETDSVGVTSEKDERVMVNRDTRLFVRSQGGRRHPITPFNFSMMSSQLVASDRDTLMPLSDIKSFEVDHLSAVKTGGLLVVGVAAVAAVIVVIFKVSGQKTNTGP